MSSLKYLGVYLDEHLTFRKHVEHIERAVGKKLAVFRRVKCNLTTQAKRHFYISCVQSVLEYASNAYIHTLQAQQLNRLLRLSKRALRIVFGYPRFADVTAILARQNLYPIEVRYQFRLYYLIHRCIHGKTSSLLSSCFTTRAVLQHLPILVLRHHMVLFFPELLLVLAYLDFHFSVLTVGICCLQLPVCVLLLLNFALLYSHS